MIKFKVKYIWQHHTMFQLKEWEGKVYVKEWETIEIESYSKYVEAIKNDFIEVKMLDEESINKNWKIWMGSPNDFNKTLEITKWNKKRKNKSKKK